MISMCHREGAVPVPVAMAAFGISNIGEAGRNHQRHRESEFLHGMSLLLNERICLPTETDVTKVSSLQVWRSRDAQGSVTASAHG